MNKLSCVISKGSNNDPYLQMFLLDHTRRSRRPSLVAFSFFTAGEDGQFQVALHVQLSHWHCYSATSFQQIIMLSAGNYPEVQAVT